MRHEKNTKRREVLVLGAFRYDRATRLLTDADHKIVHMRRQSEDVLSVLAANAGEVVSKDALFEAVWPGIATTDDSLVQCIADIRRTLGRSVVETFPKRGYRLCPGAGSGLGEQVNGTGWRRSLVAAGILAAIAALPLLAPQWRPVDTPEAFDPPVFLPDRTLAVLPFANLSGDPRLRYFSDGLSEDLTTDLSKVDQLTVISHASSFDFRDAERAFREIAEDLGVRYLVRGTVRHHGDRVRINVSLMDPYDGVNLWAERFDRESRNPFDVQEEITRQIVRALSLTLGVEQGDPKRIEPDAYYMLLRGLEPLRARTARGNLEARQYFERALELYPEYARAHANIAITYGRETLFRYSDETSRASIERGLEAAITAIRIGP
jgi:TolB-like protein